MSHDNPNKLVLTVVVATMPVPVTVNRNQHVEALIREALRDAGKPQEELAEWFLRTGEGHEFKPGDKIGDAGIVDGMTLYLSKDAGGGG